jgi:PKD repeat protein
MFNSRLLSVAAACLVTLSVAACFDARQLTGPLDGPLPADRSDLTAGTGQPTTLVTALAANKCIDVNGASETAGARLIVYTCTAPVDNNQLFTWLTNGSLRVYGNMCITVGGTGAGAVNDPLVIQPCNGGANQIWTVGAGTTGGNNEIVGITGKCVDISGGAATDGAFLILNTCSGLTRQQWHHGISMAPLQPWELENPALNHEIEGYASAPSVNKGESINLFVNTASPTYTIDVYRMGWYNGVGAELVQGPVTVTGIRQAAPTVQASTGLVEANWTSPYVLATSATWKSGIYLAKLTSSAGKSSYVIFVVRDDASSSALLVQLSINTYQAYNNWGGKSLYGWNSGGTPAVKVSLNRPYALGNQPLSAKGVGAGEFLTNVQPSPTNPAAWEYNFVRFIEREGYDVSYTTDYDVGTRPELLLRHRGFISMGHDEYWSMGQRNAVQSARDQGVHLGFFSSNSAYWQVRFEAALSGTANRTMVGYKETPDPVSDQMLRTINFRDVGMPENLLLGVMYQGGYPAAGDIVIDDASTWVTNGTGLATGSVLPGLLGYEIDMMSTLADPTQRRLGHSFNAGTNSFGDMTVYAAPSGAQVFATGSMQWAWGLDDYNAPNVRPSVVSLPAQIMTRNVLNRFISTVSTGPVTRFSGSCTGLACTFTDASTPSAGTSLVSWSYNFGDGGTSTVQNPAHTFAAAGTYSVALTVTDNRGDARSLTQSITVAASQAPGGTPGATLPIVSRLASLCLASASQADGTAILLASCSPLPGQQFTMPAAGVAGPVTLFGGTRCLDASGGKGADGSPIIIWTCGNGQPNQSWTLTAANELKGINGKCMTINGSSAAGTGMVLGPCSGSIVQKWDTVVPAPNAQAPTARFTSACVRLNCTLTDGSTSPAGTLVGWSWEFGDGTTSTLQSPAHRFPVAGTYPVVLTVTDAAGAARSQLQSVTVSIPPVPLVSTAAGKCLSVSSQNPATAVLLADCASVAGQSFTTQDDGVTGTITLFNGTNCLDASGGRGTDGSPIIIWPCGTAQPNQQWLLTAAHELKGINGKCITLNGLGANGDGLVLGPCTGTPTQAFGTTVPAPAPQAPVASFTASCIGMDCTFTDASTAPAGSVVAWSWNFGNGVTSTVQNPTYSYPIAGTYTVSLTVTDNVGGTKSQLQNVTVAPPTKHLVNQSTGLCLGVASNTDGTSLVLVACAATPAQQFTMGPAGTTGQVTLYGSKCLDAAGGNGADGSPIIIWTCGNSQPNEQWTVSAANEVKGILGKCITPDGSGGAGTAMVLQPCTGAANQKWDVTLP